MVSIFLAWVFLVQKGPAVDSTDASHPYGFSCNPVMKMKMIIIIFVLFQVAEHRWNETDRENPRTGGKICPNATLSTTNSTWTDPPEPWHGHLAWVVQWPIRITYEVCLSVSPPRNNNVNSELWLERIYGLTPSQQFARTQAPIN
jgi:hypothetical protein